MIARIIVTILFGGFGIVLLVVGIKNYRQQRRFLISPRSIEVTITASEVKKIVSHDNNPDGRDTSTNSYRPVIRFTYTIDGKSHESDLLRPCEIVHDFASSSSAQDVIAPYPVGKKVMAWYQPTDPDKAFLLAEGSAAPFIFMIVGLLLGPLVWLLGKWIFK